MEHHIQIPVQTEMLKKLNVGDTVYISGTIFTARDAAHKKMLELHKKGEIPFNPGEMALFHCGPLVKKIPYNKKVGDNFKIISAGPTTSARLNSVEPEFMRKFGIKIVIGKGGMDSAVVEAMNNLGAVYLAYPGGVGALAAKSIKNIVAVHWLEELGMPEAVWILEVEKFGPMVVAIAHNKSIYFEVQKQVEKNLSGRH